MKILYFAWLKQKVGTAEEEVNPPPEVTDVAGLLDWLARRSPRHQDALARRSVVRVAVNQSYAKPEHPVRPGDEIALFPPVTGG
ncbi:MAG TPA: molybdopterin converting factor subunit 1 [Alphaproteobacteria bacterium]|nr:molybdopterin converting factor subunit 1 [Alphaproteobacteria bacterium]